MLTLIWMRPYWKDPVQQMFIRSCEMRVRVHRTRLGGRELFESRNTVVITHEDGEKEELRLGDNENLIILFTEGDHEGFKVLL